MGLGKFQLVLCCVQLHLAMAVASADGSPCGCLVSSNSSTCHSFGEQNRGLNIWNWLEGIFARAQGRQARRKSGDLLCSVEGGVSLVASYISPSFSAVRLRFQRKSQSISAISRKRSLLLWSQPFSFCSSSWHVAATLVSIRNAMHGSLPENTVEQGFSSLLPLKSHLTWLKITVTKWCCRDRTSRKMVAGRHRA